MPTGYTAAIEDGITFEDFALRCAHAFGACVMLRDEPARLVMIDTQRALTQPQKHYPVPQHTQNRRAWVRCM